MNQLRFPLRDVLVLTFLTSGAIAQTSDGPHVTPAAKIAPTWSAAVRPVSETGGRKMAGQRTASGLKAGSPVADRPAVEGLAAALAEQDRWLACNSAAYELAADKASKDGEIYRWDGRLAHRAGGISGHVKSVFPVGRELWVVTGLAVYRWDGQAVRRVAGTGGHPTAAWPLGREVWILADGRAFRWDGNAAHRIEGVSGRVKAIEPIGSDVWIVARGRTGLR